MFPRFFYSLLIIFVFLSVSLVFSASGAFAGPTSGTNGSFYQRDSQAQLGTGSGLLGDYFDNKDFTNLKLSRTDLTVNFDWGSNAPDPSLGADTFSVRWTGFVQPQFSETYTFSTNSDDGVRLWVNNQLLINDWVDQPLTYKSGTIALAAGQKVPIKLEYYDNLYGAAVHLYWQSPSRAKQIIPASQLFPSAGGANTPTPTTGGANTPTPTATSTTASGGGGGGGGTAGLHADYFDNKDLTNLKLSRTDPTVNFDWGSNAPNPSLGADTFSVRWTGFVQPQFSETYTFSTNSDDGVRLWVNNQLLINDWVDQPLTYKSGTIALAAGQKVPIKLEYYDNLYGAAVHLYWQSPSRAKQIIPASQLFPSAGGANTPTPTTGGANTPTLTATPTATRQNNCPPDSPLPAPSSLTNTGSPHRIGVRVVNGVGEFYDRVTDASFVPRGSNYVRLAQEGFCAGYSGMYHSTFNVGLYDKTQTGLALSKMHQAGYNVVRVFLNQCCSSGIGEPTGGLSSAYLDNVKDFLDQAHANQIYVLFTIDALPERGGYAQISPANDQVKGRNVDFLTTGGIMANTRFWQDFVSGLVAQHASLGSVFAYELRNEAYYDGNLPPFTLTSGTLTTPNSKIYDLSNFSDKTRMMDENLVNFIDEVRKGILEVDPTALVTVGFFPPGRPTAPSTFPQRTIRTYYALADPSNGGATLDFVDLHPYALDSTLDKLVQTFEMSGITNKPILMGEFGAFKSVYSTADYAGVGFADWQVRSCDVGYDGWLLWTWDTDEQTSLWNSQSAGGAAGNYLAPVSRPDPCAYGNQLTPNLAWQKPVSVSGSPGAAYKAVDGLPYTQWSTAGAVPQWIEIDLEAPQSVKLVRLVLGQYPPGSGTYQIWVKPPSGDYQLVKEFSGPTTDAQVFEFIPDPVLTNVRYVKIITTASSSPVGWREVEVR